MIAAIINAKSKPATGLTGMPNAASTLRGWFSTLQLTMVQKTIIDFEVVETLVPIVAQGTVQPFTSRQLEMKPEGQRQWDWRMIHATADLQLKLDDVIQYNGTRFRIMGAFDYIGNGYVQYEAVNDYRHVPKS